MRKITRSERPGIIYCVQRKKPKCKYLFSKVGVLRPKWYILVGSKMTQSVCVCSAHQNVVLLVDAVDGTWHKKTWLCCYKYFQFKFNCDHLYITIIHKSIFFNWNINGSPYVQMPLISMMKLLFLLFLSDHNAWCCCF